jgi:branched-chain amino acid transport system permease protein
VSGAFVGGILLMLIPVIQADAPDYSGVVFLVIAVGAILLSRDPNGLVNLFFKGLRLLMPRLPLPRFIQPSTPAASAGAMADEVADADRELEAQVAHHGVA